ncbi:MAG TPA: hypothetical protein VEQ65_00840, partial [Opitutus sp.]|nr:hypothetical protein [Opitutus sp.]
MWRFITDSHFNESNLKTGTGSGSLPEARRRSFLLSFDSGNGGLRRVTERSTAAIKLSDEADRRARRLRAALPRWGMAIALIVLFAYGAFIAVHCAAVAGGSDSSGYLNSAKLLASGRLTADARPIPELHAQSTFDITPLGFTREPGSLVLRPTYPTGMPLQFAGAGAVFGPTAGIVVVCVANALGAIALCYAVGRRFGRAPLWAGSAAGRLAIDPV